MFLSLNRSSYKRARVYRVMSHGSNGYIGAGSGFFISKRQFLTCFHVIFGSELKRIRNDPQFTSISGDDEHSRLQTFYDNKVARIEIRSQYDLSFTATLKHFDERYDIVLLEVADAAHIVDVCRLDFTPRLDYGDYVSFGGFPTHFDYPLEKSPFAFHEGVLSAFVSTAIGGDKYEHLQINSISLGGNSGAPLFAKNGSKVIGILNGNMNWGRDDLTSISGKDDSRVYHQVSLRVPLSITYATTLKLLRKNTRVFSD